VAPAGSAAATAAVLALLGSRRDRAADASARAASSCHSDRARPRRQGVGGGALVGWQGNGRQFWGRWWRPPGIGALACRRNSHGVGGGIIYSLK